MVHYCRFCVDLHECVLKYIINRNNIYNHLIVKDICTSNSLEIENQWSCVLIINVW